MRRRRNARSGTSGPVKVLAVHTSRLPLLGADTWVHARLLENLDRSTHQLHAACVPAANGVATPTFDQLNDLPDVSIVAVDLGPERQTMASDGSFARLRLAWRTLPAVAGMVRLARYIRQHDIDIVHTSDRPRDALAAVLLSKVTRARSVVHLHVVYGEWMGRFRLWSLRHADARVAVSDFVRRTLEPVDPGRHRTHTVLNGIDVAQWSPASDETVTAMRRSLDIPVDAPTIITVCRLFEEKGVRQLVRALADVVPHVAGVRLVVVGIDHQPGEPHLCELRADIAAFGLDDHVQFLGRRTDVAELMAAADIFAMPSIEEPFGLVFAEAMATELPVVALDSGGASEVLVDGQHGLLSAPNDHDGLVANLLELLGDPARRASMGRAGRQHVEAHLTTEHQAIRMAEIYRLILLDGQAVQQGGSASDGGDIER